MQTATYLGFFKEHSFVIIPSDDDYYYCCVFFSSSSFICTELPNVECAYRVRETRLRCICARCKCCLKLSSVTNNSNIYKKKETFRLLLLFLLLFAAPTKRIYGTTSLSLSLFARCVSFSLFLYSFNSRFLVDFRRRTERKQQNTHKKVRGSPTELNYAVTIGEHIVACTLSFYTCFFYVKTF